ncbi:hypothetical protein DFH07DRAFT_846338 [Mycena maculata]|uniref:Uncharacterized protein n=1 Tax=Mycena maculata TaxID=230809 RepID=A0AAD7I140_9AGAR|nr:hypothetical protein DFH07DRAFT_846338 [Mycena maculata]
MALTLSMPSSWTASLPYSPSQIQQYEAPQRPLRRSNTWNANKSKFASALALDLSLPAASFAVECPAQSPAVQQKPRLRLPALASALPARRFDPFADDEPVASTSAATLENTPPTPRGRPLTPLVTSSALAPTTPVVGRRRAPSFSAGTPRPAASLATLSTLSRTTAPSACRPVPPAPIAEVKGAPTPFHARHYPTPDARARLLARTLLNRIHAVGRPRSLYSCSSYSKTSRGGYEAEGGERGYVPSRLSECVVAC